MTAEEVIKSVSSIPSYILDDDIKLYHQYASKLGKDDLIVDVGTGLGKSAYALALSTEAMVLSFDTGEYPLARNWATSMDAYIEMIEKGAKERGIDNLNFFVNDITTVPFNPISLFHLDAEKLIEENILEYILPFVKQDGILLIRNYDRCKEEIDRICKSYLYLENKGKIQVIKKI
jgi:predicted O-methyltransferase YrrM